MEIKLITKKVGKEMLVGDIFTNGSTPSVLFLHGGGTSSRKNLIEIRKGLATKNVTSIAFDFSGHGDSSSNVVGSLIKRFNESLEWWSLLNNNDVRCIIGHSMGAEIAVRLAMSAEKKATHLILVAGALYSKSSFTVPFGDAFSSILRTPNSWQNSESFGIIESFEGHLAVISAEHDTVIPSGLHERIVAQAKSSKSVQHIVLEGISHKVGAQCQEDKTLAEKVSSILFDVVK